jgi:hypothetical protein
MNLRCQSRKADQLSHHHSSLQVPTSMASPAPEQPAVPSAAWRVSSTFVMGGIGLLCGGFLRVLSRAEAHGLDKFLALLDERADVAGRERGLITGTQPCSESN